MTNTPHRPFIPTPERGTAAGARDTPFRLTPPFVHGYAFPVASDEAELPPIEYFLDTIDSAGYDSDSRAFDYSSEAGTGSMDLPPIEHFTDPLPLVDHFVPDENVETIEVTARYVEAERNATDNTTTQDLPEPTESWENAEAGWVDSGWQEFDWTAAAALGDGADPEASDEWSRTDWDTPPAPPEQKETAAQAIANALDQIAERIRKGELLVPPPNVASDPTAIAATLAALLGVRR